VAHLHRHYRTRRRDYRIVFVPEPVCWTEVPRSLSDLAGQRRRWSRGLAEVLWKHRTMIGNPRYGRIGLLAMPYFLAFELLGAVVELAGPIAVALSLAIGVLDLSFGALFAGTALALGVALSLVAVVVEEMTFHRYSRWRDLGIAAAASLLENVGYRQLHAWWRVKGLWSALRGTGKGWGTIRAGGMYGEDAA
jgi:cellulose synthase/poly-beta-1,6-N-acetylglucosamine synthase-like glycosyltransferase